MRAVSTQSRDARKSVLLKQIGRQSLLHVVVRSFQPAPVTPVQGIHCQDNITVLRQKVAYEYPVIAFFHPLQGIFLHLGGYSEGPDQFFLAYCKMGSVVVQHQYCREGTLSVRNQQIRRDTVPCGEVEFYLPGSISVPLFGGSHCHSELIRSRRNILHALKDNAAGTDLPRPEVLLRTVAPGLRPGKGCFHLREERRHEAAYSVILGGKRKGGQQEKCCGQE